MARTVLIMDGDRVANAIVVDDDRMPAWLGEVEDPQGSGAGPGWTRTRDGWAPPAAPAPAARSDLEARVAALEAVATVAVSR